MFVITIFIAILNVVAIALTYYCLENAEKKEKVIFIAVAIAIIYILTLFVYGISAKDIEIKEVSEQCKNIIISLFVPINTIFVLPIFAKSYRKYKKGRIRKEQLKNRVIILVILLAVLLIFELSYFKDIQNQIIKEIEKNQQDLQTELNYTNTTEEGNITNTNEIINNMVNEIDTNIVNQEVTSNVIEGNENIIQTNIID